MRCRNSLRFRDDVAGCAAIGHAPGCAPGFALAGAGGYAPAGTLRGMHRGLAFSQTPARKAGTGTSERDDVAAGFEMENSKFRKMMVHEKLFYSIIA